MTQLHQRLAAASAIIRDVLAEQKFDHGGHLVQPPRINHALIMRMKVFEEVKLNPDVSEWVKETVAEVIKE